MKYILLILFLFLNIINGATQNFSHVYGSSGYFTSVTNYLGQGIAFGDFDNDNDLDLIIIGRDTIPTRVYKNNGQGIFTPFVYNLPTATFSSYNNIISDVKWFDYNNDGLLDLLFFNTSSRLKVYKNTGNASNPFTLVYSFNYYNPLGCGYADLYQNGLQDIYCLANNNGNRLFKNKNNVSSSIFVMDNLSATNTPNNWDLFKYSSIFDANKDGISDIYVKFRGEQGACYFTGKTANPKIELRTGLSLNIFYAPSPPIDLNGNGNYNIITDGSNNCRIFEFNNNTITLITSNAGFYVGCHGNPVFQFFDYNNDGKIDVYSNPYFYTNNGNLSFTYSSFNNSINSIPIIADVDNDKDLDFFAVSADTSYIFKNLCTTPNSLPTAPQTLWTTMDSSKVVFHWLDATDTETPQPSLSYNVMVGTSSKAIDITSPLSDTVTGYRRVVEAGNAFLNEFYLLDKSIFNIGDTVYWSVQTIDNGFGYSPFSQEGSAIIYGRMEAPVFDTICGNDSTLWRGSYYKTTGRYKDSYNLDSAFFLNLKVHPSYLDQQLANICTGSSYSWNGNTYYNSGTYNIQHYTNEGCDSIERLILNVHPGLTVLQNRDLCMGDSLLFGGKYLKSSGIYWDSLQSVYNCDSIIQLTLNIAPSDTTVWQSGDTLFATPQNANFRWWNCDKQQFIYAANQSYYVPYQNGHYAVEISSNGCSYLTSCLEVTGLAIAQSENDNLSIRIMPNPNKGTFFLELEAQGKQEYHIQIFDAMGKEIYNQNIGFEDYKKLKIDLDNQPSGVYQLRVVSKDNIITRRFIIR